MESENDERDVWMAEHLALDVMAEQRLEALGDASCPKCDSEEGQWRGYRERKGSGVVHRRQCNVCRRWYFEEVGGAR